MHAPLTLSQERIWFLCQLDPGNPFYNFADALVLRGDLRVDVLRGALEEIVRRHGALRTRFPEIDGAPVQEVAPPAPLELPVLDMTGRTSSERRDAARRLAEREARTPFDVARGPLLRLRLLRVSEREHVLLITAHHLVCDGWSIGVLSRELAELYGAGLEGRPPALPTV